MKLKIIDRNWGLFHPQLFYENYRRKLLMEREHKKLMEEMIVSASNWTTDTTDEEYTFVDPFEVSSAVATSNAVDPSNYHQIMEARIPVTPLPENLYFSQPVQDYIQQMLERLRSRG